VVIADREKRTIDPRLPGAEAANLRAIISYAVFCVSGFGVCFLAGQQDLEILVQNTKKTFRLSGCWYHSYLF
jgi:hypothetical protein